VRWFLISLVVLATLASLALAAPGGEPGRAPSPCTWTGTITRDVKTGTAGRNVLCARRGNDFIHGAAGNDVLRAGKGRDVAVGGGGRDVVRGGPGPDRLFAVDDQGGDRVYGGPGIDQCFADPADQVYGCERAFRSNEPEMATALGQSLRGVMEIVEEIAPTTTVPPPVSTVTDTITLPPCNEGPPEPPPFCEG
jgi:Ca2+-binding RTX toxin-like protein